VHRFYAAPENIRADKIAIKDEEFHHLARVLRLHAGDPVLVFDGLGTEYRGTIELVNKENALMKIEASQYMAGESPLEIWLIQGIAKGDKMEFVIQKATELGVRGIIPLEAERSVVKLAKDKTTEKEKRWQKAAVEAAKQSGRARIPTVESPRKLRQIMDGLPPERLLLAPWEEGGVSLKTLLRQQSEPEGAGLPVYIMIGPEGGLEKSEVALAQEYGGIPVSLGPRILRTETAGLAAIVALMYERGDWG